MAFFFGVGLHRMATSGHPLVPLQTRAFTQSYFVTSHLRMHLQRCLQDMHQNPDFIRLAGGKGREGQPGHHLIWITMIPHSQPGPPKHPKV